MLHDAKIPDSVEGLRPERDREDVGLNQHSHEAGLLSGRQRSGREIHANELPVISSHPGGGMSSATAHFNKSPCFGKETIGVMCYSRLEDKTPGRNRNKAKY